MCVFPHYYRQYLFQCTYLTQSTFNKVPPLHVYGTRGELKFTFINSLTNQQFGTIICFPGSLRKFEYYDIKFLSLLFSTAICYFVTMWCYLITVSYLFVFMLLLKVFTYLQGQCNTKYYLYFNLFCELTFSIIKIIFYYYTQQYKYSQV